MNYRKLFISILAGSILFSCSKESQLESIPDPQQDPLTKVEIDAFIEQQIQTKQSVFHWDSADDHLLWSAVVRSDSTVSVGFQPPGEGDIKTKIHIFK